MRAVIQRVTRASVTSDAEVVGEIKHGLVVLLGIARDDTKDDADYLVPKIIAPTSMPAPLMAAMISAP